MSLNEAGKTIIIASHDLSLVADMEMSVALLSERHCVEKTGTSAEILADEELLLKTNLIHEHLHRHGGRMHRHRHAHFNVHRHADHHHPHPHPPGHGH